MSQAKVPPLPSHYVSRPEVIRSLKESLFSPSQTGVLVVSAIYGLGGIGKSTVAAALARDSEVLSHFPDGVLWATLGQQPDLLSFLNSWIRALGDYDYKPTTKEAASEHLRTLLAEKAALLVVDDVWDASHFDFFRVGSAGCRVLATTRSADIGGASRLDLDVMEPHQARELLREALGGVLKEADEQLALTLAAEVGYLPLALELAAAQVVSGVSWSQLLAALTREVAALETLDLSTDARESSEVRKGYSLLASLNLSLRQLPAEQLQRFAWLGVLPEDVSLRPEGMMTVWQLDASRAKETLEYLKSMALLLSGMTLADGTPTYRLHDLLQDLARRLLTAPNVPESEEMLPGLGLTLPVAHAQLLDRYRAKTANGLWHTLPSDGYIHAHLSWHLVQANRVDELHQLLQEETETGRNAWYEACDRLGELPIFVSDVARAWQQADAAFESDPSRAIALQCRYALIMSSLNSLAGNIPGELMAALVDKGLWTPAQGLAYARQIQDPEARAKALVKLASHLPKTILSEALDTVRATPALREPARTDIIEDIAAHLTPETLPIALDIAMAMEGESWRAYALRALAIHFPEILPIALDTARNMQSEFDRVRFLRYLAAHFREILPEALDTVRAIQDKDRRASDLSKLAVHFPEILPEALDATRVIQDDQYRAEVLGDLAVHFPEILPEALDAAKAIQNGYERGITISDLIAKLPKNILSEAIDTANADGLGNLDIAARMKGILPEIIDAVRAIEDEYVRVTAICGLAAHMREILPEALNTARAIESVYWRGEVLGELAAHFREILPEALDTVRAMQSIQSGSEEEVTNILMYLAPHISENLWPEAIDIARNLKYERAYLFNYLAPHLPKNILPEALNAARALQDKYYQDDTLSTLAAPISENLLSEALDIIKAIQYKSRRVKAFIALAPQLGEIPPEALDNARAIESEYERVKSFCDLAPHVSEILPEALDTAKALQEAFNTTKNILYESRLVDALSILAAYISESLLPEALDIARDLPDESRRANTFSALAVHFPEILPEALDNARAIPRVIYKASALSELAANFPEILPEALEAARVIQNESSRADALKDLAANFPEILPEALEAARAISYESSRDDAFRTIAPHLSENLLPEGLDGVRAIRSESSRAKALNDIAANFPEMLPEALDTARAIPDKSYRAYVFSAIAANFPEVLPEALDTARKIEQLYYRATAFSEIARLCKPLPANFSLWKEMLHTLAYRSRGKFLSDLARLVPVIIELSGTESLGEIARAIIDVGRQWP